MNIKPLSEIISRANALKEKQYIIYRSFITKYTGELIPLLLKLKEADPEFAVDDANPEYTVVHLRYIKYRTGIRYLGRFINGITINLKEKEPLKAIKLWWGCYEDADNITQYTDDGYCGEESEERIGTVQISPFFLNEFRNLIKALKPYFKNLKVYPEYNDLLKKVLEPCDADKIDEQVFEESLEDIWIYFDTLISEHKEYDKNAKKHFLMLPDGINIRFRGRFHNCITSDTVSVSLGYVKNIQRQSVEDSLYHDIYTCKYDEGKYSKESYQLLHEYSLDITDELIETIQALKAIKETCEEELLNGSLSYIHESEVIHQKTFNRFS